MAIDPAAMPRSRCEKRAALDGAVVGLGGMIAHTYTHENTHMYRRYASDLGYLRVCLVGRGCMSYAEGLDGAILYDR